MAAAGGQGVEYQARLLHSTPRSTVRARGSTVRALLLVTSLLGSVTVGCGDPCAELQPVCNRCQNVGHKLSCEQSVDEGDEDLCQQDIDSYELVCP